MKWLMTLFIRNECEVLIESEAEDCFKKTPTIILTARLSSSEVSLEKGFEAKTVKLTYRSLKSLLHHPGRIAYILSCFS